MTSFQLKSFISILSVLASSADEQLNYLEKLGDVPVDELALEFDDIVNVVLTDLKKEVITQKQYLCIKALDARFSELSGEENLSFWTENALYNDLRWQEIRDMAATCLEGLAEIEISGDKDNTNNN